MLDASFLYSFCRCKVPGTNLMVDLCGSLSHGVHAFMQSQLRACIVYELHLSPQCREFVATQRPWLIPGVCKNALDSSARLFTVARHLHLGRLAVETRRLMIATGGGKFTSASTVFSHSSAQPGSLQAAASNVLLYLFWLTVPRRSLKLSQ